MKAGRSHKWETEDEAAGGCLLSSLKGSDLAPIRFLSDFVLSRIRLAPSAPRCRSNLVPK